MDANVSVARYRRQLAKESREFLDEFRKCDRAFIERIERIRKKVESSDSDTACIALQPVTSLGTRKPVTSELGLGGQKIRKEA